MQTPSSGGAITHDENTEVREREHLADVGQTARVLSLAVWTTPLFALLELAGFTYHTKSGVGLWIPRTIVFALTLFVWLRLRRRPAVSRAWLATFSTAIFAFASVLLALSCVRSGGFESPVVQALSLLLIGQAFLQPARWYHGALRFAASICVFIVTLLIVAAASPELHAQLQNPEVLRRFIEHLTFVVTAGAFLVLGGHAFWSIRRKLLHTRTMGRYILEERIGAGGMGEVWRAHHPGLRREVAVKILRPDSMSSGMTARFEREIAAMTQLEHPNTVRVLDCGTTDKGLVYYVMELLSGDTLSKLVEREGPLPPARAVHIARQIARALAEAHAHGIVHRDIKPSNILVTSLGGEVDHVKVLDFGIAKHALSAPDSADLTNTGMVIGTPAYMSPEQIQRGQAGARSDLYSLGCVLHEMLTGRQLFTGPTEYAVFEKQVKERPPSVPGVPADLARLIDELLEKKPEARPPDANTLYERLQPFAVDLPMLPGFLNPPSVPSPGRMYARVVGRVLC